MSYTAMLKLKTIDNSVPFSASDIEDSALDGEIPTSGQLLARFKQLHHFGDEVEITDQVFDSFRLTPKSTSPRRQ